jgi:signal transduction histidine kinase
MELNRTGRWFYGLTLLWVLLLLGLGSWWIYLVFKLHTTLSNLQLPELGSQERFLNMMKWEGSFFFIFLVLLGASLLWMYIRDMKKTQAMQIFFSSLTHELKTPLASRRLQVEVLRDLIEDKSQSSEQILDLIKRLVEDTSKLESELEKSLQLSRVEQEGTLTLIPISLERYLRRYSQKLSGQLDVELFIEPSAKDILADELALNVIFRNLFENTLRHNHESKKVLISVLKKGQFIKLIYDDYGVKFIGPVEKMGNLFYKFNSTKGSGIGLYLIKNLMLKMNGFFEIQNDDRLKFWLTFKEAEAASDE